MPHAIYAPRTAPDFAHPLPIGATILSINGETDCDENDRERHTGPMALGRVTSREDGDVFPRVPGCVREGWSYGVDFPNGTSVQIDAEELATQPYVIIVSKPEPLAPPDSLRTLLAWVNRREDAIDRTERIVDAEDFNDLAQAVRDAADREAGNVKRWHDALADLIAAAERMGHQLNRSIWGPNAGSRGEITRAQAVLAEFKGFL